MDRVGGQPSPTIFWMASGHGGRVASKNPNNTPQPQTRPLGHTVPFVAKRDYRTWTVASYRKMFRSSWSAISFVSVI